jgi:hypothetical protein
MSRSQFAAVALLLLAAAPAAAEFRYPGRVRLEFELLDGSRICGQAMEAEPALRVATSLGEVRVPLVKLARIEVPDDGSDATLHLISGDRIKGRLLADIEVNTLVGKLSVSLKIVRSLRVVPSSYQPRTGPLVLPYEFGVSVVE